MGGQNTVLVLGNDSKSELVEKLLDLGFTPILRDDIHGAMHKIQHENLAAAFVDRENIDIDALEFILNVRDVKNYLPVIIVTGGGKDENGLEFLKQKNVFILEGASRQVEQWLKSFWSDQKSDLH